jgi:hypothetical protein
MNAQRGRKPPTKAPSKAPSAASRRGPNMLFVLLAVLLALLTIFIARSADPIEDRGILGVAATLGMFGSVVLVGLARQDTARRRRVGYIDTQAFFLMLNTAAIVAWLAGLFALYTLNYEFSRFFTT